MGALNGWPNKKEYFSCVKPSLRVICNEHQLAVSMDYRMLKEWVRHGEGKNLEFKLKTNHPDKIVREIVAFANSDGGYLLIGVGDDKSIKGLKYPDEDEYILTRAIEKLCVPTIHYSMERVQVEDEREVLVFNIPKSQAGPHAVLSELEPAASMGGASPKIALAVPVATKRTYVRVADKSVQASREVREILRGRRKQRNVRFTYSEKEKKLMQHLDQNKSITVDDFANVADIPRSMASKTLILLVLANVLRVHPSEVKDTYTMVAVAPAV